MKNLGQKSLAFLFFIIFGLNACSPYTASIKDSYDLGCKASKARYLSDCGNFTLAIYNNENRLISNPLADWVLKSTEADAKEESYTDLYIVSHGWNYTIQEAMSNYYKYIEIIDEKFSSAVISRSDFRPYFIFVVWNSVSRPITDATRSILPYSLDDLLIPLTSTLDEAFHLASVWKESINAYTNALGRKPPAFYWDKGYSTIPVEAPAKYSGGTDFSRAGRDFPLSIVLFELLNRNQTLLKNPLPKIHVIGHSHGAKLVSLATLEALNRYESYNQGTAHDAITSLVMINGAFHPAELEYIFGDNPKLGIDDLPYRMTKSRVKLLLELIPRKAVVFSNSDYPNGTPFELSQVVFNVRQAQTANAYMGQTRAVLGQEKDASSLQKGIDFILGPVGGGLQIVWTVGTATLEWVFRSLWNIPQDFVHHVKENDTFGETSETGYLANALNIPHFFLPVDKFLGGNLDEWGLFRPMIPAIGRGGLHHIGNGRKHYDSSLFTNLWVFNDFIGKESQRIAAKFTQLACMFGVSPDAESFPERNIIYTFDASEIYDSWKNPFVGSHGDIGGLDKPKQYCYGFEKREATFNFLYNFTKN